MENDNVSISIFIIYIINIWLDVEVDHSNFSGGLKILWEYFNIFVQSVWRLFTWNLRLFDSFKTNQKMSQCRFFTWMNLLI